MSCCHIVFEITGLPEFEALSRVFEEIKREKNNATLEPGSKWRRFFSASQMAAFWWPSQEEVEAWGKEWYATPLPERFVDPRLDTPWDFDSMFESIRNGEYELTGIRRIGHSKARLEFEPDAFPFGGTESLQALIKAFGHHVLEVDDGTGFVHYVSDNTPGWPEYWEKIKQSVISLHHPPVKLA